MATAFKHTVEQILRIGDRNLQVTNDYTADGATSRSIAVGAASTVEVAIAVAVANIQHVWICSDLAVTLKTNSSGAPDETIALLAGKPYLWHDGDYFANLLATDITAIFLTNAGATEATVDIEIVEDSTPA